MQMALPDPGLVRARSVAEGRRANDWAALAFAADQQRDAPLRASAFRRLAGYQSTVAPDALITLPQRAVSART